MRKLALLSLLTLVSFAATSEAAPVLVDCPDSPSTTDREFTLTTDPLGATCFDYGDDANELNANVHDVIIDAGWTLIDKDPDATLPLDALFSVTGIGATSGSFTIGPSLWTVFDEILIGFVVGGGQIDPKWAVFQLPEGETTGLWENAPEQGGGLSHANLYGRGTPVIDDHCTNDCPDVTEVPEPATLLLLGSGLSLAVRRRRAKR